MCLFVTLAYLGHNVIFTFLLREPIALFIEKLLYTDDQVIQELGEAAQA